MVKLFLFRLGSLLILFILLVWETFYRQNEENFTGMHFSLNIRVSLRFLWKSREFSHVWCFSQKTPISNVAVCTVFQEIIGRYVSLNIVPIATVRFTSWTVHASLKTMMVNFLTTNDIFNYTYIHDDFGKPMTFFSTITSFFPREGYQFYAELPWQTHSQASYPICTALHIQ